MNKNPQTFPVACNKDCGGGCALTAHVKNGKLLKITNNPLAPKYMTGCRMGFNTDKILYSPDRIMSPLLRTGKKGDGKFREISWNEAYDMIAEKLRYYKNTFGDESILQLEGGGSCHGALHNTILLSKRFFNLFGSCPETYGSYSSTAQRFVTPYVVGTNFTGLDPETLFESKLIILWGANISETRLSTKIESVLAKIKKNGIPIIVIDPRRTVTVKKLATEWIQVYPGTDTILQLAILYQLIKNSLINSEFIKKYSTGFDELSDYVLGKIDNTPKTPEWAEKLCGTPSMVIKKFAELYGKTKPAALIPGLSIQRTIGGEEPYRLSITLQTCTGNFGITGGSSGGRTWSGLPSPKCPKLEVPIVENKNKIPVYRWPDAVLRNEEYKNGSDIKMIYHVGGNYLMQGADIKKSIKAFEKVEFSVCHDSFITPTAKYCDIILPVAMWPEREDIVFSPDNYLLYSAKVVNPPDNIKTDYEIFCNLASKLGFYEKYSQNRTAEQWIEYFIKNSEIENAENFREIGIFEGKNQYRTAFSDFIKDPFKNKLNTKSGLIEISSETYNKETGFPTIPKAVINGNNTDFSLRLVTPHSKNRVNSSNGNIPFFSNGKDDSLWINPFDAEKRNIKNGQIVTVFNDIGSIETKVRITDDIMPGVVCLYQGQWPINFSSDIIRGPLTNMLASTEPTKPSFGSRTHSINVEVIQK